MKSISMLKLHLQYRVDESTKVPVLNSSTADMRKCTFGVYGLRKTYAKSAQDNLRRYEYKVLNCWSQLLKVYDIVAQSWFEKKYTTETAQNLQLLLLFPTCFNQCH